MTPLVNAIWRARLAALLWRERASPLGAAWAVAGRPLFQRYRNAGLLPRQALTNSGAAVFE